MVTRIQDGRHGQYLDILLKSYKTLIYMPKLQNNQRNMHNYGLLIIFIQNLESLTTNSIFHNILWWSDQYWRHLISVKRGVHYWETTVQKCFTIGRKVKILSQPSRLFRGYKYFTSI